LVVSGADAPDTASYYVQQGLRGTRTPLDAVAQPG
jgi:hypothetical protein